MNPAQISLANWISVVACVVNVIAACLLVFLVASVNHHRRQLRKAQIHIREILRAHMESDKVKNPWQIDPDPFK